MHLGERIFQNNRGIFLANSQRFFWKISAYLYQLPSFNTFSLSYLMFNIVPIVAPIAPIYAPFGHLFDAFCPKFGEFGKFHPYRSPFGTTPAVDCVSAESDLYDTHFHSDNCSEPESGWRVWRVLARAHMCVLSCMSPVGRACGCTRTRRMVRRLFYFWPFRGEV